MPTNRVAFNCQQERTKTLHTSEVSTFSQDIVNSMIPSKTLKHVDTMISMAEWCREDPELDTYDGKDPYITQRCWEVSPQHTLSS